jgi:hypothetical protein
MSMKSVRQRRQGRVQFNHSKACDLATRLPARCRPQGKPDFTETVKHRNAPKKPGKSCEMQAVAG